MSTTNHDQTALHGIRSALLLASFLLIASSTSATAQNSEKPLPPLKVRLEEIRRDSRKDVGKTAAALRALASEPMNAEDRASWVRLSRVSAIRTGDTSLLKELAGFRDPFSTIAQGRLIVADGRIEVGEFVEAEAELARIEDFEHLDTRDRRRYWALVAKIGLLTGNEEKEITALAKIVDELPHWPSADCQGCHSDPKNPTALPPLDFRRLWFTERYVELLGKNGRAATLRRETEARLAADADDLTARFHLYAALSAQGSGSDADRALDGIEWAVRGGEGYAPPRAIFTWP